MDCINRFVYILILCLCLGHIANGNILDTLKNVVLKLTGYDQTQVSRRFVLSTATWTSWTIGTPCSASCGNGYMEFIRRCSTGNVHECGLSYWKIDICNERPCGTSTTPSWTSWHSAGSCSVSCGSGRTTFTRGCSTGNIHECEVVGGKEKKIDACNDRPCVPSWTSWHSASSCSVSCGGGVSQVNRGCSTGYIDDCETVGEVYYKVVACNDGPCGAIQTTPLDPNSTATVTTTTTTAPKAVTSNWGPWGAWSPCSASCGQSPRTRTRTCSLPSGQRCHGSFDEIEMCANQQACPHWRPFHEVGSCSVTCGKGVVQLERKCSTGNSRDCTGSAFDDKPCILPDC